MLVEGRFVVDAPRERVWRYITDPAVMAPCVPGCDAIEVIDALHYRARVKIELGPIKAGFNLEVEITGQAPPESIHSTTRGEEGSRASIVSARNLLRLEAVEEARTLVHYSSEASVTGRLGKFGLGLMRKKGEQLGKQFAERFCAQVARAEAASPP
jgi:uncharacterized protein